MDPGLHRQSTARAFVGVHTAAISHLVTGEGDVPLQADTIPETLAMDLNLQPERELETLTTATSMLVTAAHELHKEAPALVTRTAKVVFVQVQGELDVYSNTQGDWHHSLG
jgi:hypothetical protein